jgi:hypothetical protein
MRAATADIWNRGLYAGLIGYGTVVVTIAALNALAGRSPFYTAALFGAALFYGLKDPATLLIAPGPILAYNAAHMVAFLGLGFGASWLVALAERYSSAQDLVLVSLLVVAFHVFAALGLLAQPLLGAAGWWQIGVGTLAAALLMGWYLWRGHAALRRKLRDTPIGEAPGSL